MKQIQLPISRASGLASAWQRWGARGTSTLPVDDLPYIAVDADRIQTLGSPETFRTTLLSLIAEARQHIFIATLYLQDDDAGREVLAALHAAKAAQPQLKIAVFVDWHRAQRGLIGKSRSPGNAAMYREMEQRLGSGVVILGVPVQRREFLGVMHLKGFVIDDKVLYSGASLNDVYLQRHQRYRVDRYHLIDSAPLAASLSEFLDGRLRDSPAVQSLASGRTPKTAALRDAIVKFRRELSRAHYYFAAETINCGEVGITPLLGIGTRDNELNAALLHLIDRARERVIVFTPYFNLPGPVRKAIGQKIKAGCRVVIVLGDKTANDFYVSPHEPFKAISALPYLYEANLRRFCKTHQKAIDAGILNVHLWRDGDNTFHLKGLLIDDDYALLTGNNLNPRAWRLDLENGLLIRDPQKLLLAQHLAELEQIMVHAQRVTHHKALDAVDSYPPPVQRLVKRLARVRADRLVNQML